MVITMQHETSITEAARRFGGGKAVELPPPTVPAKAREVLKDAVRLGFTEEEIEVVSVSRYSIRVNVSMQALRRVFAGRECQCSDSSGGYRHYQIQEGDIEFRGCEELQSKSPGKAVL